MRKLFAIGLAAVLPLSVSPGVSPIATAQEVPAQSMAESYQPVYEVKKNRLDFEEPGELIQVASLPRGTKYELRYANWGSDFYQTGPFTIAVSDYDGRVLLLHDDRDLTAYGEDGFTAEVWVAISYPDGSSEYVQASGNFASTTNLLSEASYPIAQLAPGEHAVIEPTFSKDSATRFSLVLSEELDAYRAAGWDFSLDIQTGALSITAPEEGGSEIHLPIRITYADGSGSTVHVQILVPAAPQPEPGPTETMADFYDPHLPKVDTRYLGSTQLESDKPLPPGTFIQVTGSTALKCWNSEHYLENGVEFWTYGTTIEMQPAYPGREACDVEGQYHVWDEGYWEGWEDVTYTATPAVLVHYPDGSRDITFADLRVRPSYSEYFEPTYDNGVEPKLEDLVVSPGGTYSIKIDPNPDPYRPDSLTDFPEGTTFEQELSTYALTNGEWRLVRPIEDHGGRLEVNSQTGEVTIELPEDYRGRSSEVITVIVNYPDNSPYQPEGSLSKATLWVRFEYPEPEPQPAPAPAPEGSGSSIFGSSF